LLQGILADEKLLGIQGSYFIGMACFVYLAFYAWRVSAILKSQGVSFEEVKGGGH
jgi:FHS family L-fucose permease-like MFS transporter